MYAIGEFTYVHSLQLCHAYARFAYMQHYSSNICNIRFALIYFCKGIELMVSNALTQVYSVGEGVWHRKVWL